MTQRAILHVDVSDTAIIDQIDRIAALMRVSRSQLIRWWIEDGIDEYTARIHQSMKEARNNGTSEKSTQGRNDPI